MRDAKKGEHARISIWTSFDANGDVSVAAALDLHHR
jgi:hypothetical protein